MSIRDEIERKLTQAFSVHRLEVLDESENHRGHAGYRDGGESHFRVLIRATEFSGQTRLARHRAVHEALGRDILARIHALALDVDV